MKIEEILLSKTYVKENGAISFAPAREYIQPFLDKIPNAQWEVEVANEVVNKNEEDETLNIAYPRVSIKGKLGITDLYTSIIGLVYALDLQRPLIKVYTGQEVNVCTNLTIFNAEEVFTQDLLGNYKEIYDKAQHYFERKEKQLEEYIRIYNDLVNTNLTNNELNELMGKLLFKSHKTKLGTTPIVKASQLLKDPSSIYYVKDGKDFSCTKWNVYNSITQTLGKSDILEKPSKVVSLSRILLEAV